jgi:hypothetical protein
MSGQILVNSVKLWSNNDRGGSGTTDSMHDVTSVACVGVTCFTRGWATLQGAKLNMQIRLTQSLYS